MPNPSTITKKCLRFLETKDFARLASIGSDALPSLFSIFKDGIHKYQIAGVVMAINDPSGIDELFDLTGASTDYGLGYFVCRLARKKGISIPERNQLMSEKLIDLSEGSSPKFLNEIEELMAPFV